MDGGVNVRASAPLSKSRFQKGKTGIAKTTRAKAESAPPIRKVSAPLPPPTELGFIKNTLGYFLASDIEHDFGPGYFRKPPSMFYNINQERAASIVKSPLDEDATTTFIETLKDKSGLSFIPDFEARKSQRIVFTVPEKTGTFKNWTPPVLFGGGNSAIGIIQDAGEKVTDRIGAQNVIAFGSILDPAGKPISKLDNPIWYNPGPEATVTIPLAPFGFDTSVIDSLTVTNFRAGLITALFNVPGKTIDGVTMKPYVEAAPGSKPINNTSIEKVGFFTSIMKANEIASNPTAKGQPPVYFNIGKTLGDSTLVNSAMASFKTNDWSESIENPFYGIGKPPAAKRGEVGWLDWITGDPHPVPPSIYVLKTGDRLNAVRAEIEGVPVILEEQAGKGRTVKQFKYTPGEANDDAIVQAIRIGYETMETATNARYDELIANFQACIDGGLLKVGYSNFAGTDVIDSRNQIGLTVAGKLITKIVEVLTKFKSDVVAWIAGKANQAVADIAEAKAVYNATSEAATRMSPQTTDVVIPKGDTLRFSMKIVVTNLPKLAASDWPIKDSLDISLFNAFSRINTAGARADLATIRGTDVDKRFFSKLPAEAMQGGGQLGGDAVTPEEQAAIDAAEDELLQVFVASTLPEEAQKGGKVSLMRGKFIMTPTPEFRAITAVVTDDRGNSSRPLFDNMFPATAKFIEYCRNYSDFANEDDYFFVLFDLYLNHETVTIIDDVILESILLEFEQMISPIPYGDGMVTLIDFEGEQADVRNRTGGPIVFNAYACHVNLGDASDFGYINEDDGTVDYTIETLDSDTSAPHFGRLETLFLEQYELYLTRTRASVYPKVGGSGRRPLYG